MHIRREMKSRPRRLVWTARTPQETNFRTTGATAKETSRVTYQGRENDILNRRDKSRTGVLLLLGLKTAPVLVQILNSKASAEWRLQQMEVGTRVILSGAYCHGDPPYHLHVLLVFTIRPLPNMEMRLFLHATRWPQGSSQSGPRSRILLPS